MTVEWFSAGEFGELISVKLREGERRVRPDGVIAPEEAGPGDIVILRYEDGKAFLIIARKCEDTPRTRRELIDWLLTCLCDCLQACGPNACGDLGILDRRLVIGRWKKSTKPKCVSLEDDFFRFHLKVLEEA